MGKKKKNGYKKRKINKKKIEHLENKIRIEKDGLVTRAEAFDFGSQPLLGGARPVLQHGSCFALLKLCVCVKKSLESGILTKMRSHVIRMHLGHQLS